MLLFHYLITSQVYQQAVDAMADPELITNFGSFLFNRGHTQRAEALYRKALVADPNFLVAKDRWNHFQRALFEPVPYFQAGKLGRLTPSPLALPNAQRHGEKLEV